jgi:hypothetical protein
VRGVENVSTTEIKFPCLPVAPAQFLLGISFLIQLTILENLNFCVAGREGGGEDEDLSYLYAYKWTFVLAHFHDSNLLNFWKARGEKSERKD